MPLRAVARLIQTMLYAQRFFPYYVYNILGGIEEDGTSQCGHERISRAFSAFLPSTKAVGTHVLVFFPSLLSPQR
jgi:hypothetical protein